MSQRVFTSYDREMRFFFGLIVFQNAEKICPLLKMIRYFISFSSNFTFDFFIIPELVDEKL